MAVRFERRKGIDSIEFALGPEDQHFFTNIDFVLLISLFTLLAYEYLIDVVFTFGIAFWLFLLSLILHCIFRGFSVKEERLIVIRELGVQKITTYFIGYKTHRFINKMQIKGVVINEGFQFNKVIFYLAFLVRGEDKLILAFEHLYPRLNVLLKIYHGTRRMIFDEENKSISSNNLSNIK